MARTVSVVSRALQVARSYGLDHAPDEILIVQAPIVELRQASGIPAIAPYPDIQRLWLVWIKAISSYLTLTSAGYL